MPLREYQNEKTGEIRRSLQELREGWREVIKAPGTKLMVTANAATGTSKIKDLPKILKERSRNFARDHDQIDQVEISNRNGMGHMAAKNLLARGGRIRSKLDDI